VKKLVFALLLGAAINCAASSINFVRNDTNSIEYGRQVQLPGQFGQGEFTLELWIKPNHLLPVGPTVTDSEKRANWAQADRRPYSSYDWWYTGNFLLDGFNNGNFSAGTFALQFYGGGRVRWLLGDGSSQTGGVRAVGAYPASSTPHLLDGRWHQLTLVRRWSGTNAAQLELWIDGVLIDTEAGSRANMRQWWDSWYGFGSAQAGWFWGAEKQAALGMMVYEDYRGLVDELRFWSRAKSSSEIQANWNRPVTGTETGLVGWYAFGESGGSSTCDSFGGACMSLHRTSAATFSAEEAPLEVSANGGALAFNPSAYSAAENAGVVTISVVRSGGAAGAASVSYATSGGNALANADYEPASGVLTWAAGQAGARTFQVRLLDDQESESAETIDVTLSSAAGAALQNPTRATITIPAHNETAPTPPPPTPPSGAWSDNFNRSDAGTLGNGWIEKSPAGFSIAGQTLRKADTTSDWRDNLVYRPASEDLRDVEASFELRLTSQTGSDPGVIVRAQPATIAQRGRWDGYLLYLNNSRTQAVLARQTGAAWDTPLAYFNLSTAMVTGATYRLRLRAVGQTPVQLNAYVELKNGTSWQVLGQSSYSDASSSRLSGAGSVGFSAHYTFPHVIDNFQRVPLP
jgi:hypothetical protein